LSAWEKSWAMADVPETEAPTTKMSFMSVDGNVVSCSDLPNITNFAPN
jgi:hypothetical protein